MKTFLFVGIFFVSSLCSAIGQDFKTIIQEMQTRYAASENFHIVMAVNVFKSQSETSPFYSLQVDIKKEADQYRYKYGDMEMLLNDQYLVVVDRAARQMIVSVRNIQSEEVFKKGMKLNMDSVLSLYNDAKMLDKNGQTLHYRIEEKSGGIKHVDLYINEQTKFLSRITYEYGTKQFASISFEVFDTSPDFATNTFLTANYFSEKNGKLLPSESYKGFQINQPGVKQ